jgi:cytochrome c biogenesis protein CcdA/copper chaperone CopZ
MAQRRFEVPQIHCQGCQQTITGALGDIDGIDRIDPDITTNVVTVDFDQDRISADEISHRLAQAGFPVQDVAGAASEDSGDDTTELREDRPNRTQPDRRHDDSADDDERGAASRYGLLVTSVLAIALAGYTGYVLYPRFDLPAAQGAGLLGLAAAAGIASFFSPCSFPLLLGLLGRQAISKTGDHPDTPRPVVFGGALALAAAMFMLLAGVVIGLGGEALFAGVTFTSAAGIAIRAIVGVLLILLGLVQVGRLPLSMHAVEDAIRPISRRSAQLRRQRPVAGFTMFGFSYVLAGFG